MKKKSLIIPFLIFSVMLFGQEKSQEVFAPFVSRLKARAVNSGIELTWKDSSDIEGENLIYRANKQITTPTLSKAKLIAHVKQGIETYTDYPVSMEKFYYAVLIQDKKGKLYKLLIPFRNITTRGVSVKTVATEEQRAAKITDIRAKTEKDSVLVTFKTSNPKRYLLLFRNTSPFNSPEDLLSSTSPVTITGEKESYKDYPIPGINYYYALLDAGLFKIGKIDLKTGKNTTVDPVMIPLGVTRAGLPEQPLVRPLPLPYLLISSSIDTGSELSPSSPFSFPEFRVLKPDTRKAVTVLENTIKLKSPPPMQVQVLSPEKKPTAGGEEYTLYTVVAKHLTKHNFSEAGNLLNNFLSIYHSEKVEARAHFYLGQSYYFQARYKNAFLEFLMAEDLYYQDVQNWLNAIFNVLINTVPADEQ